MIGFLPFKTAEQALDNIQQVAEGKLHQEAAEFIKSTMPSVRKSKYKLAVEDARLPASIEEFFPKLGCVKNEVTDELFRGIRMHYTWFLKNFDSKDLFKTQLGLAHAFSRSKVQNDVNKQDKHIIHSIALLEQLDKDINTFAMRLKEWFSWHFPELKAIVPDNIAYARCVKLIVQKENCNEALVPELEKLLGDAELPRQLVEASRLSMGQDLNELDEIQINIFADRVILLAEFRDEIGAYLKERMHTIAPNLSALIGELVGARLIAQSGSLMNLAKYPASTVQILGAEKALFRALKTKGNTPKYGILYHSSFIGKAGQKNKGRISRYLANKCSLASRIDAFFPVPTTKFGERMHEQVEERLRYFNTGERGPLNEDVMHDVLEDVKKEHFGGKKKRKTREE
jgi:nucleolar protein 56